MGTRMDQLMETLHVVIKGQEELHQSVSKLTTASPSTSANGRNDNANVETPTGAPRNDVDDHHDVIDLDEPQVNLADGVVETAKMYHALEERLRAMEGIKASRFNNDAMCLVPGVVIPPKFKVPEFDKYKGTSCPKTHLRSYCRKMAAYAGNEPLLMHFFQDSLTGASLD